MSQKAKKRMSAEEQDRRLSEALTFVNFPNVESADCQAFIEMYWQNARDSNAEILSFGGGIQSTTLLYRGVNREIEGLGAAIFADTGWERDATYKNVEHCIQYAYDRGVPVFVVSNGNIREDTLDPTKRAPSMPFFIDSTEVMTIERQRQELEYALYDEFDADDYLDMYGSVAEHAAHCEKVLKEFDEKVEKGEIKPYKAPSKVAMLRRQCTNQYKIRPIQKLLRGLTGCNLHYPTTQWIGISLDEVQRMKQPRERYVKFRYPLIQDRWTRQSCIDYIADGGYPNPGRSACPGCPYHDSVEWKNLTAEEFEAVCEFDEKVREIGMTHPSKVFTYTQNRVFLHRSLKPMRQRPFEDDDDDGQLQLFDTKDTTCDEGGCFL